MIRSYCIAVIVTSLASVLLAVPAQALLARTFVSAAGNDANNCASVTSPCRHFQAAAEATATNGEIYVLDPANYGSVTIIRGVSIEGHGWASIAPVSGSAAITITAPRTDTINIIGVVIDGTGLANTTGIAFNSGAALTIQDSVIRNVTGDGIHFVPVLDSSIAVANTFVASNGGYGILVKPQNTASATATFDHVKAQYNGASFYGLALSATSTTGTVSGTATDVDSSNNGGGFLSDGAAADLTVMRSVAAYNHTGVQGIVRISQTAIVNNVLACEGIIFTYGDNSVVGHFAPDCIMNSFGTLSKL